MRPEQAISGLQYAQDSNSWKLTGGCANLDGLPTINLKMGDFIVPLTPQQYMTQVRRLIILTQKLPVHFIFRAPRLILRSPTFDYLLKGSERVERFWMSVRQ